MFQFGPISRPRNFICGFFLNEMSLLLGKPLGDAMYDLGKTLGFRIQALPLLRNGASC